MSNLSITQSFLNAAQRLGAQQRGKIVNFLAKLMQNPALPSLNMKPLQGACDARIRSARVDDNIRAILLKVGDQLTLLHVDNHDEAYRWAETRKIAQDQATGQIRVIAVPEVIEHAVALAPQPPTSLRPLLENCTDDYLLSLGVPSDYLPTMRRVVDVQQLYEVNEQAPELAGVWEKLIRVANGETICPPLPRPIALPPDIDWVADDVLDQAWSIPLDKWRRFLHPRQEELVTVDFDGPAKVTGAAGTGKTVIGLHRAVYRASKGELVLLTTYTTALRNYLDQQLRQMCPPAVAERVRVVTLHAYVAQLLKNSSHTNQVATEETVGIALERHAKNCPDQRLSTAFLRSEWKEVIATQGIETLEEYIASERAGRGSRLGAPQRASAWTVFEAVIAELGTDQLPSFAVACKRARQLLESNAVLSPYDAVIVDEVQDFGPHELRFLAYLSAQNLGGLLLLGDAGQRIYPGGYRLKTLGIDVTGRSKRLNVGYRTGELIRQFAERVLSGQRDDLDGNHENNDKSFALRKGTPPCLRGFASDTEHDAFLVEQVRMLIDDGYDAGEIGIIGRSRTHLERVGMALRDAGISTTKLGEQVSGVNLVTMHSAKGLEYRAVFVVNCQFGTVPNYSVTKELGQEDLRIANERERRLLYVSLTRGREALWVTWAKQPSVFLESEIARAV